LKDYAALTHLQSAPNGRAGSLIDDLLERAGFARRIVLRVPSLLSLPPLVAGSNHCATVPGRLAAAFADVWGLVAVPLPFEVPRLALNLVWHTRADHDAGHTWLRDEILGLFAGRARADSHGPVGVLDLSRRSRQTL
jgi:DNA-binding transcriptional LysR family regulator